MTTETYLFAIACGSTLLTLVGLYTGWRSFRVFLLRLDLLSIRNNLWDEVRAMDCLSDPAYLAYRENLNLLVRHAHKLDLISLALSSKFADQKPKLCPCDNPVLAASLETASAATSLRISTYMLWHRPFSGIFLIWTLRCAMKLFKFASNFKRFSSSVARSSVAQISSFGQTPDLNTKNWFEHDGPSIIFKREISRSYA